MLSWIRRPYPLAIAAILAAGAFPSGKVRAQDDLEEESPTVQVRLAETEKFPGQVFTFYLVVENAESVSPGGQLPAADDFAIRYVDSATTVKVTTKTWALTYQAVPVRGGSLRLPSIPVVVDGVELWNAPVRVEVREPIRTKDFDLTVELSKSECYVGEAVLLRFVWESRLSLNGVRALVVRVPALTDPRFRALVPEGVDSKAKGTIGIPVGGERVIGRFSEHEEETQPVSRVVFERVLVPRQEGSFRIPASTLLCSYFEAKEWRFRGSRYPSYFNNDFFDHDSRGEYQRLVTRSQEIPFRVLPLPREGRPPGFSGTVGAFSVESEVEPEVATVLEPMTMTVSFKGHPFPQALDLPPLTQQPALAASFRIPEEQALPTSREGVRRLVQTIRPLHDGVAAVPALRYDFFDPSTRRYGTASSQPISIRVKAARAATAFEAEFTDGSALRNQVLATAPGLRHNRTRRDDLLRSTRPVSSAGTPLFWLSVLALPPLLCLLGLRLLAIRREHLLHPERVRARRAFREFRSGLPAQGANNEFQKLHDSVTAYLADRTGRIRGTASPPELLAAAEAGGAGQDDLGVLEDFLERADFDDFGGREGSSQRSGGLRTRVVDAIVRIERVLQRDTSKTGPVVSAAGIAVLLLAAVATVAPAIRAQADASAATDPAEILDRAETLFAEANEVSLRDPARGRTLYAESAAHFESLLDEGIVNAPLHSNLANARFLEGDVGRAILHYHRALMHDPGDGLAREGLQHARERRPDVFPHARTGISAKLTQICEAIGTRRLRWLFALSWIVIWAAAFAILARGRTPLTTRVLAASGLAAVVFGVALVAWSSLERSRPLAVVLAAESMARKGDGYLYEPAFPNPVHSGAEFRILETRDGWVHAEFPNGERGWLPVADSEQVIP